MSEMKNEDVKLENEIKSNEPKGNLKNSKKRYIANLIAIILTVSIGMIMIGLYPRIQEAGIKNSILLHENSKFVKDISANTFVLYKDGLEIQQGKEVEASDIYLKPQSEVEDVSSYQGVKHHLNDALHTWQADLENNFQNLDYALLDKDGNLIKTNNKDNLNTLLKCSDTEDLRNIYSVYITMKFDEYGQMTLTDIYGTDEYNIRTLLLESKLNDLIYTNDLHINNPIKNMTFIYGINKELKYSDEISKIMKTSQRESYSSIAYMYVLILAGIVTILSFCIPLKFEKEISLCKKFFKVPFEIAVILISILISWILEAFGELVVNTLNGDFLNGVLSKIGIESSIGNIIVYLFNLFYWSVFIILIFISIVTIKNIFSTGLIKYFKEKTLTYISIRFIIKNVQKLYKKLDNTIQNVNLKDKSNKIIIIICVINCAILFILCRSRFLIFIYTIALFFLLKKYYNDIKKKFNILLNAMNKIANGNLEAKIDEDVGLFNSFKELIEKIQIGFEKAVAEEVKSQRMKTELISNVSHDLKTPLTSIITYVDLLKGENITQEERKSYIDTIDKKSQRLKFLIEDLFEVSKATSGNITLNLVKVDIAELMKQTEIELEDKINNQGLKIKNNFPKNKVILELDSQKTFRIFENLLINVVKYAMKNSRVYVDIIQGEENVEITIKNMSAEEITFNAFDIVERFQRGDKSRNTEGSGLGLAIAKSFVEAQGGTFNIEIDGDLFKAIITFVEQDKNIL